MNKMLVASDFSKSAIFLNSHIKAFGQIGIKEVVLVHVLNEPDADANDSEGRRSALEQLEDLKGQLEEKGFVVQTFLRWGDPAIEINTMAAEEKVDFVLLSSLPRHYIKRAFLGSVSLQLAKISSCPVVMVKKESPIEDGKFLNPFKKALIPTDFSLASLVALDVIKTMRNFVDEVVFVHVLANKKEKSHAEVALTELVEELKVFGIKAIYYIVKGSSAKGIIKTAQEVEASIVLLPKTGAGVVKSMLVGSTAQKVAVELEVPVVVIPT